MSGPYRKDFFEGHCWRVSDCKGKVVALFDQDVPFAEEHAGYFVDLLNRGGIDAEEQAVWIELDRLRKELIEARRQCRVANLAVQEALRLRMEAVLAREEQGNGKVG